LSHRVRDRIGSLPRPVIVAVAVVLFVAGVFAADSFANTGEVRQGVSVAGVRLSGLRPGPARARLEAAALTLATRPLTVRAGDATMIVRRLATGVRFDVEATLDSALAYGRNGPFDPHRARAYVGGADLPWETQVDPAALAKLVAGLNKQVGEAASEPSLKVVGTTPVLTAGVPGRAIDLPGAERVLRATVGDQAAASATLPIVQAHPTVSPEAASQAEAAVKQLLSAPIVVTDRGKQAELAPAELALAVVAAPKAGQLAISLDLGKLGGVMRKRAPFAYSEARDASFEVGGGKARVVAAVEGRQVDLAKAAAAVVTAGTGQGTERSTELPVTVKQPALTTAEARKLGVKEPISVYTTQFSAADRPRVHNISLIGASVNNQLVRPGEIFSMNGATGERTAAKGYRTAHVIMNGEIVDGLGGGVCQAGTTVFNAVFFAGLEVVQRSNHSLHISRYPMGRDATLNWPNKDLRFRNDTPYGILIRASVSSSSMTVALYSTKLDTKVSYSTSGQRNFRSPSTRYVDDPALPKGEERVEASGSSGFDVTVRRTVRRDGKVIHSDAFVSNYIPWTKVVHRGTKPKSEAPAPPA
jgi:vancomycin resistance protein YoaR